MDEQPEEKSFIQTEFFFYMLTCYYALAALSARYYSIMKDPPEINAPELPAESMITCMQAQSQTVPGLDSEEPPASYSIKSKLCLLNASLYLFMAVFTLVGTGDMFYACKHKKYGIVYVFGFMSWFMGAVLLRREYQRKLSQSLWTHRIVWIFSAAFSITKMFEDYLLLFNFLLNVLFIAVNFVLATYGIYRPQDNDTIDLIHNEEIPSFVKIFFQYIELNPLVRRILLIKEPTLKPIEKIDGDELQEIGDLDIKFLNNTLKITTQSRREEINLLNTLPRRNIFIDKKMQYVKTPNGIKSQYFVLSQIGNQRFQTSRAFEEFQKLDKQLCEFFGEKNFPKIVFPKLKFPAKEEREGNCSEILESWLTEIMKKPIFITKTLLEFLNISNQSSIPFQTYFDYSFRSFCSRSFMIGQIKKKEETRKSLVGYFQEQRTSVKMDNFIKEDLAYLIDIDEQISGANQYGYSMTCIRKFKKNQRITWKIRKTTEQIKSLNQRIEEQCKISVPFYYQMVTNLGNKNVMAKKQGFKDYLMKLLKDHQYYCPSLFQFIRFDPIQVEVKILGTRITLSSQANLNHENIRNSHYFEQYDLNDDFLQIVRVDRVASNSVKLGIKRRDFVFSRFNTELEQLRKQLKQIYEGVSYVPAIQFEQNEPKKQIKAKCQRFLVALQKLPKIEINQCYIDFYHNMI